jgi:hypothetical protein
VLTEGVAELTNRHACMRAVSSMQRARRCWWGLVQLQLRRPIL